jgi:ribosomal protein S12 methylthiotransferase accessory factor
VTRRAPGPDDPARSSAAEQFLAVAAAAARRCGVTRLADITGLDRIGLPVWQAVRPAGRALSVHQGKGANDRDAKIGALCEAIESHCAENAPADGPLCRFADLPAAERASELADYARRRDRPPPDEPVRWCRATDLLGGGDFWLPHDLVSLDFSGDRKSAFDRSSAGLGLGPDIAAATEVALREIVERDAVGAWQRRPFDERMRDSVDLGSIGYRWFGEWRRRFDALGIDVAVFAVEAAVPLPVAICWIGGAEAFGPGYRSFAGSACHPDPERALFKALAEAVQSRLTFVAGVRDDIMPEHHAARGSPVPAAARAARRAWAGDVSVERTAALVARAGYDRIAVKRLDTGLEGLKVVKAFVPGLGSLKRTRREATR